MKKLHLVLKGKWFDMIDSGVKTEEYREIKQYWLKRLVGSWLWVGKDNGKLKHIEANFVNDWNIKDFMTFDVVEFKHGYSKDARVMKFEMKSISIGTGNPDWGAEPGKEYFVIKLGKRL